MTTAKLQPALLAGVAIGVLTALPVVNIVNLCCCAWVIFGGALAAYLSQQNQPAPISTGDGALTGLMAGAIGAIIGTLLTIPIALAMGPFQAQIFERLMEGAGEMPPEFRVALERWRDNAAGGAVIGIGMVVYLMTTLFIYSIFGMLGGLLGALMFRSTTPPPPPQPPSGFEPPVFSAPPPLPSPAPLPPPPPLPPIDS